MKIITAIFENVDVAREARQALREAGFESARVGSEQALEDLPDSGADSERLDNSAEVTLNGTTRINIDSVLPLPSDTLEGERRALLTLQTSSRDDEAIKIIQRYNGTLETVTKDPPESSKS